MDNVGASIGCRSDLYHTGYVNRIYCPYCGKKIKVVGQMNKRQWKKQGTKLRHNGHYASYVGLFLGMKNKGKPHLDRKWLKR